MDIHSTAVDYYSCATCGHIWTVKKKGDGQPFTHVTPLKKPPEETT